MVAGSDQLLHQAQVGHAGGEAGAAAKHIVQVPQLLKPRLHVFDHVWGDPTVVQAGHLLRFGGAPGGGEAGRRGPGHDQKP
ncbi:hypothetical protein WEI85_06575 [Actinomycetes bacterium KLBMP 9797]